MNVSMIRALIFGGTMIIFGGLQFLIPSRPFTKDRWKYMVSNILIVAVNNLFILVIPIIPYGAANLAMENDMGLLLIVELPAFVHMILGIVFLDIVIYFQHRIFHQVDFLWRLHSMHHCDPMLDATSGLRFHPLEILISNFIKVSAILIFGIMPLSVIVFEVGLNVLAIFNHSNIRISEKIERWLNKILITPAIHTIHHSKFKGEINSNYGFSVPWWDMLFGSFVNKGRLTQSEIKIGYVGMPVGKEAVFPWMLAQPFMKQ